MNDAAKAGAARRRVGLLCHALIDYSTKSSRFAPGSSAAFTFGLHDRTGILDELRPSRAALPDAAACAQTPAERRPDVRSGRHGGASLAAHGSHPLAWVGLQGDGAKCLMLRVTMSCVFRERIKRSRIELDWEGGNSNGPLRGGR